MVERKNSEDKESFFKKTGTIHDKREEMERREFTPKTTVAPPPVLAKYMVKQDDTLSGIALKHYGNSTRDYWMLIYEVNKTLIGDNPSLIRPGMELIIPELPPHLKEK